jgi:hypothetical protein
MFPKHAMGLRSVVGFVDISGVIQAGDRIVVEVYEPPSASPWEPIDSRQPQTTTRPTRSGEAR